MDLLSSIRKSGSRGGVNFSWDEVQTSQHRENYLGHSLMAPVGRWQKGKDLSWYAKADDEAMAGDETAEERQARERKEEIRKIKEAEEDALARALGLPVADRNVSGANAITVGEVNRVVKEEGLGEDDADLGKGKGFGDFVGKVKGVEVQHGDSREPVKGGLVRKGRDRSRSRSPERERKHKSRRDRSSDRERRRHRSRSREERHRHRHRRDERDERRPRSREVDARKRRYRSRSPDRHRGRAERESRRNPVREERSQSREARRERPERPRRSRSPDMRDSRSRRDRD